MLNKAERQWLRKYTCGRANKYCSRFSSLKAAYNGLPKSRFSKFNKEFYAQWVWWRINHPYWNRTISRGWHWFFDRNPFETEQYAAQLAAIKKSIRKKPTKGKSK